MNRIASLWRRPAVAECAIVFVLLASTTWWGTKYWYASLAAGRQPIFYQEYFEPAVMMACGHGFGVLEFDAERPKALADFLSRRTDRFDCRELPANPHVKRERVYEAAMRYLLTTVAAAWRVLGISWSGLGPLCGLLIAISVSAAYGIFRLGMPRWAALGGAAAFAMSTLQLRNAPHFRDYAKAPFALLLVLLLGRLLKDRVKPWGVIALAAGYGAVLGVGYGFRSDFLAYIPVFPVALFGFLEGGVRRRLGLKAGAFAVFLAMFFATAWPVLASVSTRGGCEWHVALLGMTSPFDQALHVERAPYTPNYEFHDGFMFRVVTSSVARRGPLDHEIEYCSPEYDRAGKRYFMDLAAMLPADFAVRAFASVRETLLLPFNHQLGPLPGWFPLLYRVRAKALMELETLTWPLIAVAVLVLAARSPRWAASVVLFVLYLGGYPALQSDERHSFHLEFITLWLFGLVAAAVVAFVAAARRQGVKVALKDVVPDWKAAVRRPVAFALVLAVVLATPLSALRWYQQRELRAFFGSYIQADRMPLAPLPPDATGVLEVPLTATPGQPAWSRATSGLVEFDVDATSCGPDGDFWFVYHPKEPGADFSWDVLLPRTPGTTRVFFPVYEGFFGVRLASGDAARCIKAVSQVKDVRPFRVLMLAVLPPGWEERPLYQRIGVR